ncbi:MAG TPA: ABC transporter permease, partial [Bacteroidales bacterium]|nr:ABC transporter permease [Bacteroidales bacterium]
MIRFVVQRLLQAIPVLWGVITLIFVLFQIIPGDPARMVMGQRADSASLEMIRADLGTNLPVGIRYLKYLNDLSPVSYHNSVSPNSPWYLDASLYAPFVQLIKCPGNGVLVLKYPYLRRSYQSRNDVSLMIRKTLPNTIVLATVAILFASLLGIFLGLLASMKKDSFFDRLIVFFTALGISLPSFFAAVLIGWLFAFVLGDLTGLNLTGNLFEISDTGDGVKLVLKNIILPALTLGIRPLSVIVQMMRGAMTEVMAEDYIRTARAKGLSQFRILMVHAFRNALNPVITSVS